MYSEPTSPTLMRLMRRAEAARESRVDPGSVELIPHLYYAYGTWTARFQITAGKRAYALGRLSDFVERFEASESFAYGKDLEFTHVPAAFTPRGLALARLLQRIVRARGQASLMQPSRGAGRIARDVVLFDDEVAALLGIMVGSTLDISGKDPRTRALTHAQVTDQPSRLGLAIERVGDEGYAITRPDDAVLVRSADAMFVWQGETVARCPDAWLAASDFLAAVLDREADELFIAADDAALFCATLLPAAEASLPIDVPPELEALKPVPCVLRFYFDRERDQITCEAKAAYGKREVRIGTEAPDTYDPRAVRLRRTGQGAARCLQDAQGARPADAAAPAEAVPLRDVRKESAAEELVARYFGDGWLPEPARLPLGSEEEAARLLFGGLAAFRELGEVHVTPAFERLLRDKTPRITIGVSLAGDLLNLTVQADDLDAAELADVLASYRRRKSYHRLRDGAFLNLAECDLSQLDRIAGDLGVTQNQLASGRVQLPSFRAFYLDEEENLERDRSFDAYVEGFRAVNEDSYQVPASLRSVLRPYQAEGFRWLAARCDAGLGGVLADEMGLGKSVQLIALLLANADRARKSAPSLIVCPASLVYNWVAEFQRFAPGLRVRAVAGAKRERLRILEEAFGAPEDAAPPDGAAPPEPANPCDVLVTSYDTLRIDSDAFSQRTFWCCALDEAHYIKNPATRITRAAKRVRAQHRFALTGTPMENRLSDVWSIFDFLMPGILGPYTRFRERFELPIAGGDEDAAVRLRGLIGPFLLRRRKADVLADLPEKLETVVYAELHGEQRRLYDAHEQQLRERLTEQKRVKGGRGRAVPSTPQARNARDVASAAGDDFTKHRVEVLAELTRLRLLCCDPALVYGNYTGPAAKLQVVVDLVESAVEGGEKVLVFSQFTSFLQLISEALDARRIAHFSITGATPKRTRVELAEAFNRDDTPAFLVSLKAGGTGLNLTGASVVVLADPWWNAAAENQATDRAHRIGQTRAVSVQKVIAKGTIEERIMRLQQAKSELTDQVVKASGTPLAGMTREDLLELLEG